MRYGADCLLLDKQKRTPMAYAQALDRQDCIAQLNTLINQQFLIAFYRGKYKKSKQLLEQIVDCNVLTGGGNPLLHNIIHYSGSKIKKFIALLVTKGAHPDGLNEDGETALWHLMRFDKNALDIFEELLRVGGRVDCLSPKTHYSLLGLAVHCKKIGLVKLFLHYGALISKKMVEESLGDMKLLLKQSFNVQKCYVCAEHTDNLSDILCKNRHMYKFICVACYNKANVDNNQCPFCFERLN
jgi:ankyrin repeat protein